VLAVSKVTLETMAVKVLSKFNVDYKKVVY
jgi:hypothetical protein